MSTPKKNTRRDAEDRRLMDAWGLTLNAARDIRTKQIESGSPSVNDVMPALLAHFDRDLRDPGSLCLGVIPDAAPHGDRWLLDEEISGSGPVFADTSVTARTVAISGTSNSGKTTLLHVLIEQAVATTSPYDTSIVVASADSDALTPRLAEHRDRIGRVLHATDTAGQPIAVLSTDQISTSDSFAAYDSKHRGQRLVFIDDLDLALSQHPELWDLLSEVADDPNARIFFTAASATPRSVPRVLLSTAVRVNLGGGTLPGTPRPQGSWMFASSRAGSTPAKHGICFGDLPAGSSPIDPDAAYHAPHGEALELVRTGGPGASPYRRYASLNSPFTLADLRAETEPRSGRVPVGVHGEGEKGAPGTWFIDFDELGHFTIAGAPGSGRTTAAATMILSSALIDAPGLPTAFMIIDGGRDLRVVSDSPNVAVYASARDADAVDRILAAVTETVNNRRDDSAFTLGDTAAEFLEARTATAADPYGRLVLVIDGIGAFLGEERGEQARRLIPIIERGAAVGVHLVFTVDSAGSSRVGNAPHYSCELPSVLQLWSRDYSGSKVPPEVRMTLNERIPEGQPGRSVHPTAHVPVRVALPALTAEQAPGSVAQVAVGLRKAYPERVVPKLRFVEEVVDMETIWGALGEAPVSGTNRAAILGCDVNTTCVTPLPNWHRSLLVYGERDSGRTSAARALIDSVTRTYTPKEAVIVVIDPLRDLLGERDRLVESGYLRPRKAIAKEAGRTVMRPSGYAATPSEIEELVQMLIKVMASRRPGENTTSDQLRHRTYFEGPEIFVFVDNFAQLVEGFLAKSVFDNLDVDGQTITKMLATGMDLGVHFIVTDDAGFADRVKASPFLMALRDSMMTPILQLSGQPSSGMPIQGAYHLKPRKQIPGRGRLIVDVDTFSTVQVGWVPPTESEETPAAVE